jgi:hypothetical protein
VSSPHRSEPSARFATALSIVVASLSTVAERDWMLPAGSLTWTCWQTADHLIDCLLSFSLQLAARAEGDFLPFQPLHALPEATSEDLLVGLQGVGYVLSAILDVSATATAGDGLVQLDAEGWAQRGAYETLLHGHDILSGLGERLRPGPDLCEWVLGSPTLWMFDQQKARTAEGPWAALLLGSGRPID